MKRDIVVLVGRSATGKTTIEKELESRFGFHTLISHTSRPMRTGEQEGVQYYFTNNAIINAMINRGETVENTTYHYGEEVWKYALSTQEIKNKTKNGGIAIVTVNPDGLMQLVNNDNLRNRLLVVKVKAEKRKVRYMTRQGGAEEGLEKVWEERNGQDAVDFSYFRREVRPALAEHGIPIIEFMNSYNPKEHTIPEANILRLKRDICKYTGKPKTKEDFIHQEGNIIFNEADDKYYEFVNGEWRELLVQYPFEFRISDGIEEHEPQEEEKTHPRPTVIAGLVFAILMPIISLMLLIVGMRMSWEQRNKRWYSWGLIGLLIMDIRTIVGAAFIMKAAHRLPDGLVVLSLGVSVIVLVAQLIFALTLPKDI